MSVKTVNQIRMNKKIVSKKFQNMKKKIVNFRRKNQFRSYNKKNKINNKFRLRKIQNKNKNKLRV